MPAQTSSDLVEQRILEQATRAGADSVVTGWAALRLGGGGFFDGLARDGVTRLPVTVAANRSRVRSSGNISVTEDRVPEDEITLLHGMRCAVAERALYDEMQRLGELREMAVAAGAAYAAKLTSIHRMRLYAATRRWYRDVRLVKEAIEMSCEGLRSPQEDRFRMIWEYDAGWGRPLCNREVRDLDGRFLGVPDLLDPVRGVVGEYAGADHRDIDQHESDVGREADLRGAGLEYVEVVGRDLRHPERVLRRMEEAAERAVHLPRRWQLGPERSPTFDDHLTPDAKHRRPA